MVFIIYYEVKTVKLNKINKYKYIINIFFHYIGYSIGTSGSQIHFFAYHLGILLISSVPPLPLMAKNRTI